ncbi:hypothetical protein D3OALGA1CA_4324 [Olavius algarvensis associated proteobacterium Delta 3]|nr:hypothetical protein D3OALGB2SA_137 [Olavius algarvensis associated proteobacterium Delta 3]CAB5149186.1 hypothetical protein D3OALGA1CA_4324 [Olavius algarvensis associated proteobacterium Delta 3]
MARPWRIEFEGALYHVFSRGNESQRIFLTDADRHSFLNILGRMSERFNTDIFAFVLMDTHYHLLIRTPEANLSKSMQWFGTTYTIQFNIRHSRKGHLFQGRYKSILVENDAYLLRLSYYIHRNPMRAGLVYRLVNYRWSSYPAYAYQLNQPTWLNTEFILSQIGEPDKHRGYRNRAQKYSDEKKSVIEEIRYGLLLGTPKFAEYIKSSFIDGKATAEIPAQTRLVKDRDPQEILNSAVSILDCDIDGFRIARRIKKDDARKRDLLIYLLWQTGNYTNSEIGRLFGLSYSSISRRIRLFETQLSKNGEVKKLLNSIKSQIKV